MNSYGYMSMYKPPKAPSLLAQAAAAKDPYGLAPNNRAGPYGAGPGAGFAAPSGPQPPRYTQAQVDASLAQNPLASHGGYSGPGLFPTPAAPTPTAAAVNHYDLNADPALQRIESLAGTSNEQAQSGALKQRQNLLLAYGDKGVAESVLGTSDPIAAAAGQNPTSTVAQLSQSRDRNLKSLDEQLNQQNLGYSGYRVTQEQAAGQDYQNALAQAAAGLNSNLDTVGSNLAAALAGNNQQIVQGINSAADRANANATASGVDPGAVDPNALAAAAAAGGAGAAAPSTVYSGASPNAPAGQPVGTTDIAKLYQLLGRKTDPRFANLLG